MAHPFSSGRPRYSLRWADGVVSRLRESHARAMDIFEQVSGLTDAHLAYILARNNGEWHLLRRIIARVDDFLEIQRIYGRDARWLVKNVVGLIDCVTRTAEKERLQTFADWLRGLTSTEKWDKLEEPDEKGGEERR